MTFKFGDMDFSTEFPTSEAIQREWSNLSGLGVESLAIPRMEHRRFLETTRPRTSQAFDVILHGDSEAEVEEARQQFLRYVDPTLGPLRLILDEDPDWFWTMTVSREIIWERLTWACHMRGYRLRATVVFESYNDAAQRLDDEQPTPQVPGSGAMVELEGNTRTWPTVEITGVLSSAQEVEVIIGDFTVRVAGPLTSQDVMVLNYMTMRFEVYRTGVKIASLVPRMSTLDRVEIRPQTGPVFFSAAPVGGGSVSSATILPNSRKQ